MKVFWSWQSDTPGKIGRHFVRDALLDAISRLQQVEDVEEPSRRETLDTLHLDQDRQGVSGSPDLAAVILEKIRSSRVFIADVTSVGATPNKAKNLINSNVAIELGYALHALGDNAVLMVMNTFYGKREQLPFDLRHKAGPLMFELAPTATKKEIASAKKELSESFAVVLRPYVEAGISSAAGRTPPMETMRRDGTTGFFDGGEHLFSVGEIGLDFTSFAFTESGGGFLRVIPQKRLSEPLSRASLAARASVMPKPLERSVDRGLVKQNKYGIISAIPKGRNAISAMTQVFLNGEIWGICTSIVGSREDNGTLLLGAKKIELTFIDGLDIYLKFASEQLSFDYPYMVEIGLVGVEGAFIVAPEDEPRGPIHDSEIVCRLLLRSGDRHARDTILQSAFNKFFDSTGYSRPDVRLGFQ